MAKERRSNRLKVCSLAVLAAALALTAAWRWTPLQEFAEPAAVARELRLLSHSAWTPVLILAVYVLSNAVMFPNTVLCFATILALGSERGFLYATGASVLAAVAAYAAGRYYGPERIRRMEVRSLERLSEALRRGGVFQITLMRLLPLAPFSIVNVVAGAAHVRLLPFTLGTLLGLLPGNLLMTAFGHQLRRLLSHPTPAEAVTMAVIAVGGSVVIWQLQRLAAAQDRSRP